MRRIIFVITALFAMNATAMTFALKGGGFTLLVCDDVVFTHYAQSKIVNGKQHNAGDFTLTCPRTNPAWSLTITGCPTHQITSAGPGASNFTC